jgi:hypothetical protein
MNEPVTATWGERTFTPVAYNTFKVGPFSYTTQVRPGESPEAAISRAQAIVDRQGQAAFEKALADFLTQLKQVGEATRAASAVKR